MDSRSSQLPDSSNLNHSVQQEVLNSAPSLSSSSNSHVHSLIADLYSSVANIMEDQEEIINSYLYFQVERFCSIMQQQRMEDLASIMRRFEMATTALTKLKDEELMKADMRAKELQECLKVSREETKMWQMIASENEAVASDLRRKLQQVSDPCANAAVEQGKSEHDECAGMIES